MGTQFQRIICTLSAGLLVGFAQCVRGNVASQALSLLLPQAGAQAVKPEVTLISGSEVYLSAQPGARNSGALIWSAAAPGSFLIRLSTDCASGTVLASGDYSTPDQPKTLSLAAGDFAPGTTPVCVRVVTDAGTFDERLAYVIRDDDAPTVVVTPGTGAYAAVPEIAVSCVDPGGSGCGRAATAIGVDPVMDLNGVLTGTDYTGPFNPPDSATTAYRFRIMDRAGNQSAVATSSYIVDSVLPSITMNSVAPSSLAVSTGGISFSYKTNVKGTARLRVGGTDCGTGTVLATASILSINPAANRTISATAAAVSANLAVGPNDIRLCIENTAGLVSYTTRTFTRDVTAPSVSSITVPSGTVDPNNVTFLLNFDEPMKTTASCPLALTIQGASVGCAGIQTWITSQSLEVKVFPVENADISWTMNGVPDLAGNLTAAPAPGSFRTAMQARRRLPVTETQQTLCYDNTGMTMACAGSGQNGSTPAAPLSMLLSAPFTPDPSYPADAVVTDGRTGLMWMVCPTTQTWNGTSCTGTIWIDQWPIAYGANVLEANQRNSNAGYAGFRDWRLPTMTELATIKTYGSTALPAANFPGAAGRFYWTSTGSGSTSVYLMTFMNTMSGPDTRVESPTGTSGVSFLVRDPAPAAVSPTFTDNGDGTLWDSLNQLTWQKCSAGQPADCSGAPGVFRFADAVSYCSALGAGWRIPTIKELKSIVDYGAAAAPYVYADFAGTSGAYWSSTVHQSYSPILDQNALDTSNGTIPSLNRDGTESAGLRCVKGP